MATLRIRTSNSAPPNVLAPDLPLSHSLPNGQSYRIVLLPASALAMSTRDVLFRILDRNMRFMQDSSSFPYTEESKKEEMFDPTSRFLLALKPSAPVPAMESKRSEEVSQAVELKEEDVIGFVEWRFDTEETLRGSDVEVAYLYEIQMSPLYTGSGIGRHLVEILEEIGDRRQMQKVMLTCLKSNSKALRFYEKLGYEADEIDPTRMEEEGFEGEEDGDDHQDEDEDEGVIDYVILSKPLSRFRR
ncbi:hypothetical protein IAR50_002358 [Cryptococcus sp. DSM 104548]